ncbi:MAG: alpha/beta hydrolase [Elusimicrobiota bacterium]|jgi:pimeloyl-ACP methyl ester carboxylesterase
MNRPIKGIIIFAGLCLTAGSSIGAMSHPLRQMVPSYDGYGLDMVVDLPTGVAPAQVEKVVVLLHGSGPQSMDEDLGPVSTGTAKNRFFVDVSDALTKSGFAVLRYNKRSFQVVDTLRKDPAFKKSPVIHELLSDPLGCYIKDAIHFAKWAKKKYPNAKIYLLGHSEGGYIALQIADREKDVSGVGLISFYAVSQDALLFEQTTYRPLSIFDGLDRDRDGALSPGELSGEDIISKSLSRQLALLDIDGDGVMESSEFMAGNFSNLLADDPPGVDAFRRKEAELPKTATLLRNCKTKVAIFQGEWDNQVPSYQAKAADIANRTQWKKTNIMFRYFPKLGHALDVRSDEHDLTFGHPERTALQTMSDDLKKFWR